MSPGEGAESERSPAAMVLSPKRIQRQRTKGWRLPEGAVYVGRPTVWGNPWRPEDALSYPMLQWAGKAERIAWAVRQYESDIRVRKLVHYDLSEADPVQVRDVPARLGGRDLACWCPLNQPCHADVLLALANPTQGESDV